MPQNIDSGTIIFLYKMAEFQELTKAINDNPACLVQTAQNMDQNNRTLIKCTRQIYREVGFIDLNQDNYMEKLTGVGHIRIFIEILNNMKTGSKKLRKQHF